MKYPLVLHDNVPAHKARTMTKYLLPHSYLRLPPKKNPFSPDLAPCDLSLFPKLKFDLLELKKIQITKCP